MTPFFKSIHDGQKLFVMNLVVDFSWGKLMKMKTKHIYISNCENTTPISKLEAFVSKINGLEGST